MPSTLTSLTGGIGSLVTGLSGNKPKRSDWTTAKTASLARVNDIRHRETAIRRSCSNPRSLHKSRSRSLTPASTSLRRSSSMEVKPSSNYGYGVSPGFPYATEAAIPHSQSAYLGVMRTNYQNDWQRQQNQSIHQHPVYQHHHHQQHQQQVPHQRRQQQVFQNNFNSFMNTPLSHGANVHSPSTSAFEQSMQRHKRDPSFTFRSTSEGGEEQSRLSHFANISKNSESLHNNLDKAPKLSDRLERRIAQIESMKRQARAKRESTKGGRVDSNRHKNFSNQSTKDGREDSICWNNFDDVSATDELSMKSSNITVSAHTVKTAPSIEDSIQTAPAKLEATRRSSGTRRDWLSSIRSDAATSIKSPNSSAPSSILSSPSSSCESSFSKPVSAAHSLVTREKAVEYYNKAEASKSSVSKTSSSSRSEISNTSTAKSQTRIPQRDGNRGVEKVNLASSESIATSASGTAKTKRRISLEKQASLVSDKKVSFTDKPDYILDSKDDEWRQNFAKASDRSFSEDLSKLSVSTIRLNYDNDDGSTKQCCGISTASAAVSKDGSLLQSNASAASIDSLNSLFGICNEETAVSKHIKDLPSSKADSDTEPTVNTSIASLGNDDRTLDSFLTQTRKQGAEGYKEIKVVSIHNQSEHLTSPSRTRHPLPQRKYSRSKSTKSGANSHTPHSYSKVTVQRRSSIPADALRSTLSSRKNDRNAECPSPNQVPGKLVFVSLMCTIGRSIHVLSLTQSSLSCFDFQEHSITIPKGLHPRFSLTGHPPPPPKRRTNKGLVRYKSNGCIPPPPPPPRNQSFTRRSTS